MENGIRPPIQMAVDSMRSLCLGYTGEANAQLIQIDVIKWQEKWPGASIDLMLALPGEKASYPAKTELRDGKLLFLPGYGDTQKPGHGAAYVVATKDGTHLAASDTVLTEIMHKGRGGDELPEAPEAQAGWVADVLDAAHRAEEAAKRAENAGGGAITDEQIGKAVEDYLQENPVEVPVQSVNGKTGKVQLSAADVGALPEDTPIPAPYTLPTASADTLGGVKVGKGLQMDGDALGVDDPEMELIETVTMEESAIFERTEEPDGTPYNFKKLQVKIRKPATVTSHGGFNFIMYADTWGTAAWCASNTDNSKILDAWFTGKIENRVFSFEHRAWAESGLVGNNTSNYQDGDKIMRIRTSAALQAGMIVEIKGVRADA